MGLVSRVDRRDVANDVVGAVAVDEHVVGTQVEVGQIVGDPQQREVDEPVGEQVDRPAVIVFHPAVRGARRVGLGAQVDAAQGQRERAVDDEDRLAVLEGQPRAGRAEPRGRGFAGDHELVGVDVVVDRQVTREVVRDLWPELLRGP
ncbi:hypothetical protein MTIM_32140 [Mycobacterium timonense]|uniref:Uncharacterized protein n=1 Tax=Mycobacterium timonense TaxID=701043 RepID=A0A7I9Z8Z7_9MYCO|nr:hypothetical protein MTIM_32140 [Mycobacterium timonense]